MVTYAIKVGSKYFKDFIYADKNTYGRYGGHFGNAGVYNEGDIIDIELTKDPDTTLSKRSIATKIQLIYDIDKFKTKKVSIVPIIEQWKKIYEVFNSKQDTAAHSGPDKKKPADRYNSLF